MPDRPVRHPGRKPKALAPVHPNAGIEAEYRARLDRLISEMHRSIVWWITAQYRANPPEMASDESAAAGLIAEMGRLGTRWLRRLGRAADELGTWFGKAALKRSDAALKGILKRAGISVEFKMTPEANDVMRATIGDQVGLIKSIASQHLTRVQGAVMRSVQTGRDIGGLTKELEAGYGITRKRAAFIARDQNNKATASITRVRQTALGITQAKWLHSGGGRHPRLQHVEFSQGKRGGPVYDVSKGAFLEGKWTWPGYEINCRCVSKPIVEGFS